MVDPGPESAPVPNLMTMRVVWFAFLTTQGVLLFAASMAVQPQAEPLGVLAMVFPVLALLMAVATPLVRRVVGRGAIAIAPPDGDDDISALPPEQLRRYQATLIVGLTCAEVVTLLGFAHAFLGGSVAAMLPYVGLSALLILAQLPSGAAIRLVK